MSNLTINRTYPQRIEKIKKIENIEYPKRTLKKDIENIKNKSKKPEFIDDYNKWKSGKNYLSKSKNKIKIDGSKHIKIGEKFHLVHYIKFIKININHRKYYYEIKKILFNEIDDININWEKYFLETTKIYNDIDIKNKEIDKQNEIINKKNKEINNYNNNVCEIILKIKKLIKWDDYIIFKGEKYGIPTVFERIHRENDCNGLLEESFYESCKCRTCENWLGCSSPTGTQYYKCNKCSYKNYYEEIKHYKNHKGK